MRLPRRPIVRYPGGKWRIAKWIISHFPPPDTYDFFVDNPAGGGSITMNLPKVKGRADIINDINEDMVNVFEVLRDEELSKKLQRLLVLTPHSRYEYERAYEPTTDKLEWARRVIFRSFAGIGGDAFGRGRAGFRTLKNYESALTTAHEWENYAKETKYFCIRLAGVVIEKLDAIKCIKAYDSPRTLFYIDLPYLMDSRTSRRRMYKKELADKKDPEAEKKYHIQMAEALHSMQGMAIISHYDHPLYQELYADWRTDHCEARKNGNMPSEEWIWISPNIPEPKKETNMIMF